MNGSLCHAHLVVGEGELLVDPFNEIIPRDLISAAAAQQHATQEAGRKGVSERAEFLFMATNNECDTVEKGERGPPERSLKHVLAGNSRLTR